jgi:hypothetical protein
LLTRRQAAASSGRERSTPPVSGIARDVERSHHAAVLFHLEARATSDLDGQAGQAWRDQVVVVARLGHLRES